MRSDLREDFEHFKNRYEKDKTSLEEVGDLIFKFNCYINAETDSADDLQRAAKRKIEGVKEMVLLRDLLLKMKPKEML